MEKVAISHLRSWALTLLVLGGSIALFYRTAGFSFINFDDGLYVVNNQRVLQGFTLDNVAWAARTSHIGYPQFLTWLSFFANVEFFGPGPGSMHLVNVVLHGISACLLLWILHSITGSTWKSFLAACLFAFHPQRSESVAWVAERKDVLCMMFGLLTLLVYIQGLKTGRKSWRLLSIVCYALALLAKPMAVVVVPLLVLVDCWMYKPAGPQSLRSFVSYFMRCSLDKLPFIILAGAMSIFAFSVMAESQIMTTDGTISLGSRIALMANSYVGYLRNFAIPLNLSILYPLQPVYLDWKVAGTVLLLAALTLVFLIMHLKGKRALFIGWCWFLVTIIPVSGLLQNGPQSMADRYSYLSSVGLTISLLWGIPELARWSRTAMIIGYATVAAFVACCWSLTWIQLDTWKDSESVWRQALLSQQGQPNVVAHTNLASTLLSNGDAEGALEQARAAIHMRPDILFASHIAVYALLQLGDHAAAEKILSDGFSKSPHDPGLFYCQAILRQRQGDISGAMQSAFRALQERPRDGAAYGALSNYYEIRDEYTTALKYAWTAAEFDPLNAGYQEHLWKLLRKQHATFSEALEVYTGIVPSVNTEVSALCSAARVELAEGRPTHAETLFRHAGTRGYLSEADLVQWARASYLISESAPAPEKVKLSK